jgi:hypothetical protein
MLWLPACDRKTKERKRRKTPKDFLKQLTLVLAFRLAGKWQKKRTTAED